MVSPNSPTGFEPHQVSGCTMSLAQSMTLDFLLQMNQLEIPLAVFPFTINLIQLNLSFIPLNRSRTVQKSISLCCSKDQTTTSSSKNNKIPERKTNVCERSEPTLSVARLAINQPV
jgi:hypothetical protein